MLETRKKSLSQSCQQAQVSDAVYHGPSSIRGAGKWGSRGRFFAPVVLLLQPLRVGKKPLRIKLTLKRLTAVDFSVIHQHNP